jgi:hypothetical protein
VVISIVFFFILWTLKILEDTHHIPFHILLVKILVPGYVGITCLYNLVAPEIEKTHLITLALLFAMFAEIVNAIGMDYGLLFFGVTHALLLSFHWKKTQYLESVCTIDISKHKKIEFISLIIFAILYLIIVVVIELNLHEHNIKYELVIPLYMLILSMMAWRSVCTYGENQSGRIIIGSILFYLCDVFILGELTAPDFRNPPLLLLILSWITYLPALFLLSTIGKKIFNFKKYKNF